MLAYSYDNYNEVKSALLSIFDFVVRKAKGVNLPVYSSLESEITEKTKKALEGS